ncbi:spore coat protein Y [Geomicrobium sp. JCM 19037]|uniref:CotY/CotZ family spore coat protein n=1 Tax=unclassified Geomicrobium TaxID=2628951 RepID=UPI00045F408A|nr:CotY/CotZ family spore coat protein [Geomicrobium sp. JCM 19037]GAK03832.1 spore coat protein Y [Geomicrobium sp. JCM 19037]
MKSFHCHSCSSCSKNTCSCVCETLKGIAKEQDRVQKSCGNGCYEKLLNPEPVYDTVPLILTTNMNRLLYALGDTREGESFITVFFRVDRVDGNCAVLELLRPFPELEIPAGMADVPLNQVVRNNDLLLVRTGQCTIVDCECLCTLKCLDPSFVE